MNRPFLEALEQIGRSKNIEKTVLISALQEALISASKKTFGTGLNISIDFTEKTGDFKIYLNKKVVETVSSRLDEDARVIWGASISEDLVGSIKTILIITGVKSTQIFGREKRLVTKKKQEIESELGIEFVD